MALVVARLSLQSHPSAEGSALAQIERIIASFEAHNRNIEPKAFQALKDIPFISTISESNQSILPTPSSTVISADNINDIDIRNMEEITPKTVEIIEELQSAQCMTWRMQIVPKDFYARDLEYRAMHILSAPSPKSLCKSLLMRNTKWYAMTKGIHSNLRY